jgi:cytochrome P450
MGADMGTDGRDAREAAERSGSPLGADLTDLDNFANGFPHHIFEAHRRLAPVFWHEPTEHTPDGEGFWSVATYDEVLAVLLDPRTFSSETGGSRPYGGTVLQDLPVAGVVLNMMDDPRHARIRRLVSKALTPAVVRGLEDDLRRRTRALLARIEDGVPFDFVSMVAAELPMQAICFLLGVPESDRHWLFECVEHVFDLQEGTDYLDLSPKRAEAMGRMAEYGRELVDSKRGRPAGDMLSVAVHAELPDVDPPMLGQEELESLFSLLFAAGSETTRNAIAGGLLALLDWPDELEALRLDPALLPRAVEEVLRWTTPSPSKRRTATCEARLADALIEAGEKVLVWEASANRDSRRFDAPMSFRVARDPNPHLSFGHGAHFCLGARLARLEIQIVLEELLRAFSRMERAGEPEWARSSRHTGFRRLPVVFSR